MRLTYAKNRLLARMGQIALVLAFWLVGELIARLSPLPIPGPVIGLVLLLAVLASGKLNIADIRLGAESLLAEMLLFFIPAVLVVLDHRELVGLIGLKIMAVILAGTVLVMSLTALSIDLGYRVMVRAGGKRHAKH